MILSVSDVHVAYIGQGNIKNKIKKYFIEHRTTHCVAVRRTVIIVSYLTRLVRLHVDYSM